MAREKKCSQCAEMVKPEAVLCRFCGHSFPPEEIRKPPISKAKGCLIAIGALLGLGLLVPLIGGVAGLGNTSGNSSAETPAENQTAEEKLAAELRTSTAMAAGRAIKTAVRNPDSLVIEGAWGSKDGQILCVAYRAQNGFGGMNREKVIFVGGRSRQNPSFWNKHCMDGVEDVTSTVKLGISTSL